MRPSRIVVLLTLASLVIAVLIYSFLLSGLYTAVVFGVVVAFGFENIGWYVDVDAMERGFRLARRFCQLTLTATLPFVFWINANHATDSSGWLAYGIAASGIAVCALLWVIYIGLTGFAVRELYATMRWPVR